jgi:hypothetical protein
LGTELIVRKYNIYVIVTKEEFSYDKNQNISFSKTMIKDNQPSSPYHQMGGVHQNETIDAGEVTCDEYGNYSTEEKQYDVDQNSHKGEQINRGANENW